MTLDEYKASASKFNKKIINQLNIIKEINLIIYDYGYNIKVKDDYTFSTYYIVYNEDIIIECNFHELENNIIKLIDNI